MKIFAIDPGPEQSAWVEWDAESEVILGFEIIANERLVRDLSSWHYCEEDKLMLALEMVACYGMPVGREVFETVFWIGRFAEAWNGKYRRIYRREVKTHICHNSRAKDSNIRQALIDRFGPPGTKKNPGKTYGMKKDLWQALALAVTCAETKAQNS